MLAGLFHTEMTDNFPFVDVICWLYFIQYVIHEAYAYVFALVEILKAALNQRMCSIGMKYDMLTLYISIALQGADRISKRDKWVFAQRFFLSLYANTEL